MRNTDDSCVSSYGNYCTLSMVYEALFEIEKNQYLKEQVPPWENFRFWMTIENNLISKILISTPKIAFLFQQCLDLDLEVQKMNTFLSDLHPSIKQALVLLLSILADKTTKLTPWILLQVEDFLKTLQGHQ